MASPFKVLLAAVLGKEGRQPKLQCPTHTHTLKINMLQCLKYLAEAICRALRGRRGEELLHNARVGIARRGGVGQRRWRACVAAHRVDLCLPGPRALPRLLLDSRNSLYRASTRRRDRPAAWVAWTTRWTTSGKRAGERSQGAPERGRRGDGVGHRRGTAVVRTAPTGRGR